MSHKFKVGDRVRIVKPNDTKRGCEATIYAIGNGRWIDELSHLNGIPGWRVDVDGHGRFNGRFYFAYVDSELEPPINPDEEAWQAFKSLHLKPDPALILAKEAA